MQQNDNILGTFSIFSCSILFPNAMANSPSKLGAMAFSLCVSILITPILYFVIDCEHDYHNRTLINQLVSSLYWVGILWNLIMQPLTLLQYMIGPLHFPLLCGLDTVLRNALCMHGLLLLDSIIIVRIIFVYFLKNPTALNDKFWILFINLALSLFSFATQALYVLLPGKNPINYLMCTGNYPVDVWYQPVKVNWSLLLVGLFSIFLHFTAVFVKLKTSEASNEKSLFSKTSNSVGTISLISFGLVVPSLLNKFEPPELDQFPNYLLLYLLHHYNTQLSIIVILTAYFYKTTFLRKRLLAAVKYCFDRFMLCENDVVVIT